MSLPTLTQAQKDGFFTKFLPYAQQASKELNIPVSVILSQWAHESYYGYSDLAKRAQNYAGIKYSKNTVGGGQSGMYASYSSLWQFVQDYVRVMKLSYYTKIRTQETDLPEYIEAAQDLGASPYAESHYGGGKSILDLISQFDLTKYDNGQNVTVPNTNSAQVTEGKITIPVASGASDVVIGITVLAVGLALISAAVGAVIPDIGEVERV